MVMIGVLLDMAGWFLIGVAAILAGEGVRVLVGLRRDAQIAALQRRLADVTALRARDGVSLPDGPEIASNGIYEYCGSIDAHHGMACPNHAANQWNGTVPRIIAEHIGTSDRATDRAYADAGIMPVRDYVAKYARPVCDETEGDCA